VVLHVVHLQSSARIISLRRRFDHCSCTNRSTVDTQRGTYLWQPTCNEHVDGFAAHLQSSPQVQFSAQLQLGEHASQAPTLEPAAHAQLQPGPQSQVAAQPHEFSEHFGHVMTATAAQQTGFCSVCRQTSKGSSSETAARAGVGVAWEARQMFRGLKPMERAWCLASARQPVTGSPSKRRND